MNNLHNSIDQMNEKLNWKNIKNSTHTTITSVFHGQIVSRSSVLASLFLYLEKEL